MKRILLVVAILMLSIPVTAQKDLEKKSIKILPDSELTIIGSTNVNKFFCDFNIDQIAGKYAFAYIMEDSLINFCDLRLKLDIAQFDCGNKRMNSDFRDLLMGEKFPEISIVIDRLETFSEEYKKVFISVQLAGKINHYDLPVQTINDHVQGIFRINIRDFGLEPPKKALGLIEVDQMIEIQFDLNLQQ